VTIKEYIVSLDKKVKNIKVFTEPLRMGALDATQGMSRRIFDEGQKTDRSELTPGYSEKPTYISMAAIPKPKGTPTGKPTGKKFRTKKTAKFLYDNITAVEVTKTRYGVGESKFKDGKSHKSKYFASGYKGYRENVGRQTDYVDLKLSGELRMDFNNDREIAEPRKINNLEYQIRLDKPINQKKREGLGDKYGTIFTLSDQEKEHFFEVVGFEFRKALSK